MKARAPSVPELEEGWYKSGELAAKSREIETGSKREVRGATWCTGFVFTWIVLIAQVWCRMRDFRILFVAHSVVFQVLHEPPFRELER